MNSTRTFGFSLLLLAIAGSASANDGSSSTSIHSDCEAFRGELHHIGYQGPVDAINKPQPYADSTGGASKAIADHFGMRPDVAGATPGQSIDARADVAPAHSRRVDCR